MFAGGISGGGVYLVCTVYVDDVVLHEARTVGLSGSRRLFAHLDIMEFIRLP